MSRTTRKTLLDYNPTELELFSASGFGSAQDYKLASQNWDLDTIYTHIYMLFMFREDKTRATFYFEKIKSENIKADLTREFYRI